MTNIYIYVYIYLYILLPNGSTILPNPTLKGGPIWRPTLEAHTMATVTIFNNPLNAPRNAFSRAEPHRYRWMKKCAQKNRAKNNGVVLRKNIRKRYLIIDGAKWWYRINFNKKGGETNLNWWWTKTTRSWWLNQPIWNICASQIGWFPQFLGRA